MADTARSDVTLGGTAVVAVFNASSDTVTLLRDALDAAGFRTVAGHILDIKQGGLDLIEFVERHTPSVVVYDISLPYDVNWRLLRLVRSSGAVQDLPFVITTTNKAALHSLVGDTEAIEIIGKPYDLQEIVAAVHAALPPRP